jgi:hypothetical protein
MTTEIQQDIPPKKEEITKLTLFWGASNDVDSIRQQISSISDLVILLNYGYKFQMPSVGHDYEKPTPKFETYTNWRGKERQREIPNNTTTPHHFYLKFANPLTDEELKFWRIFKLGYLSCQLDPKGSWRK